MINIRSLIAQKLLNYLMMHESGSFYVNELSRNLNVDRGNLVRKLQEFEAEGILKSKWHGNQRHYSINLSFPLLKEYKKIILKTIGFEKVLRELLLNTKGVKKAVLFGSYAADKMHRLSDIDLLIVGDHDVLELQKKVLRIQSELGREINIISMDPAEYEKRKRKDPFLRSVIKRKNVILI